MPSPYPLITSAPDGHYSRLKSPPILSLAVLSPSSFLADLPSRVVIIDNQGRARPVVINGHPKTWKRTPRIQVPWKYGFRGRGSSGYFTSTDGSTWDPSSLIPYRVLSRSTDGPPEPGTE